MSEHERRLREAYDELYGAEESLPIQTEMIETSVERALADDPLAGAPHPTDGPTSKPAPSGHAPSSRRLKPILWVAAPLVAAAGAVFAWTTMRSQSDPYEPGQGTELQAEAVSARLSEDFGGASVERLEQPTELSWRPEDRTLRLERGRILVELAPHRDQSFRVETEQFTVEVTGTVFEVGRREVEVHRGSVRVRATDDTVLRETLRAGESWQFDSRKADSAEQEDSSKASPDESSGDKAPGAKVDLDGLLSRAAEFVRQGQPDSARKLLAQVLAAQPGPAQRARAEVLLADCAQLEGSRRTAENLYRRSSSGDRDPEQAQAALFAAARLAMEQGRTEEARRLFRQYLRQYPDGELQREVVRRLHQLDTPKD